MMINYLRRRKWTLPGVALPILFMLLSITAIGQNQPSIKLTLNMTQVPLKDVLKQIETNTDYKFFYNNDQLDVNKIVDAKFNNETLTLIFSKLLSGYNYSFDNKKIIISLAQTQSAAITVQGNIIDNNNLPISGATVLLKGTQTAVLANDNGGYKIMIPVEMKNPELVFSMMGFASQEKPVGNNTLIDITLKESADILDEVVVIGYGSQKKVNLSGAVSAVPVGEMNKRQVGQTSLALQGLVPGLTVTQNNGQPGRDGGTISIRGKTTLNNNDALILVDGVDMGINNIDPNLIESVSVLKDASSAAIYGSRAANGVILITTKRAKTDMFNVSYNAYVGFQQLVKHPEMVDAIGHMTAISEAYTNTGKSPLYSTDFIKNWESNMAIDPDNYPNTDWFKETFTGKGLQQNHFLTVSGGSKRIRTMANFGYFNQNGITENTNFKRYTFRVNTDMDVSEKLTVKIDTHVALTDLKEPTRIGEAFRWASSIPAMQAGVLSNGQWGEGWNGDNPIAFTNDGGLRTIRKPSAMVNAGIVYKPIEQLTLVANYAPNYYESHINAFNKVVQTYKPDGTPFYKSPTKSSLTAGTDRYLRNSVTASATFEDTYVDKHNVKAIVGYQQEDERYDGTSGYRENFIFPQYPVLSAGSEANQKAYGSASEWALQSVFGRINYNYKERYLLEANMRYDGSSRFAKGQKWGVFPSFSGAWRISEESFWKKIKPVVDNFKIRASYGRLGNQNVGNYAFSSDVNLALKYIYNEEVASGAGITSLANQNISWESTDITDFGIDVKLWNKFMITADYFYKKTNNILLYLDIPLIIGMQAPAQNAGVVENKGWEVILGYSDQLGDFRFKVDFNISDVRNKILNLHGVSQTSLTVNNEGGEMNSLYGLEAIGYITPEDYDENNKYLHATQFGNFAPGDIKYKDQNGDGAINPSDRVIMGGTIPRFTYGLSLYGEYKGFDLSMFWQGVGKANGYINGQGIVPFYEGGTIQTQHWDRNQPALGIYNAEFPRFAFNEVNNIQSSSFWIKDASYLRLKNIQLGYALSKKVLESLKIKSLRVYLSADNLLTFDRFWDCYDVEAPIGNGGFYPVMRTFSMGVNLNF